MISFNYVITDENGIHARPAGLLVKEAKEIPSKVIISCNGKSVEATKLIAIMSLGVKKGTKVTVTAEGDDEEAAIKRLEGFFKANL
jgi:phosphocarrier protein